MIRNCKMCNNPWEDEKKSSLCPECRSKLGRRSKRKGSANEHRFAQYLNEQFKKYGLPFTARRTPRSGGIQDFEASDILFKGVPPTNILSRIHFENKNTAQWAITDWMAYAQQKEKETGRGRNPILVVRKPNQHEEYAIMKMEYMVEMLLHIVKLSAQ